MQIIKSFNNNIALAKNEKNKEVIVIGTGIGFNKKNGDHLERGKIEKIFYLESNEQEMALIHLLSSIPIAVINTATEIVKFGEKEFSIKFSTALLIALADHIHMVIKYQRKPEEHPLKWMIIRLYQREYKIGQKAVQMIADQLNYLPPDNEIISIALHFVNAQTKEKNMNTTMSFTEMSNRIVSFIEYFYQVSLVKSENAYLRFITHLQFLLNRLVEKEIFPEEKTSEELYNFLSQNHPKEQLCVEKISELLFEKFSIPLSKAEKGYLVLHVNKLIHKT